MRKKRFSVEQMIGVSNATSTYSLSCLARQRTDTIRQPVGIGIRRIDWA
jgi:hypothetical protein